jgi:hypothetical protein
MPPKKAQGVGSGTAKVVSEIIFSRFCIFEALRALSTENNEFGSSFRHSTLNHYILGPNLIKW